MLRQIGGQLSHDLARALEHDGVAFGAGFELRKFQSFAECDADFAFLYGPVPARPRVVSTVDAHGNNGNTCFQNHPNCSEAWRLQLAIPGALALDVNDHAIAGSQTAKLAQDDETLASAQNGPTDALASWR